MHMNIFLHHHVVIKPHEQTFVVTRLNTCIIIMRLLDKQEPPDVDNEPVEAVPEPDPVNSVRRKRHVLGQLGEGLGQALLVGRVRLGVDEILDELVIRVLEAYER